MHCSIACQLAPPVGLEPTTYRLTAGRSAIELWRNRLEKMQNASFPCGFRRRPTLPGRVQPSTIGAEGLNFCVRNGNRWNPFAIATENCIIAMRAEVSSTCPRSLYSFYTLLSRPFSASAASASAMPLRFACFAHSAFQCFARSVRFAHFACFASLVRSACIASQPSLRFRRSAACGVRSCAFCAAHASGRMLRTSLPAPSFASVSLSRVL